MKKILYSLVVMLFFFQDGFSQEYSFDNFYEYNTNGNIVFFLVNSQDPNYIFIGWSSKENIYGRVRDFKTNESHNYDVTNYENSVLFNYIDSMKHRKVHRDFIDKKISYDYVSEKIDSVKTKVTVVKSKKKKNKYLAKLEVISDNTDFIFHDLVYNYFSHHFFDNRDRIKTVDKLPISIHWEDKNGYKSTTRLTKRKKTNTLLSIGKDQLKYKE